ncbi:MAG: HAD family hydrolase [Rhodocyclales bacterium RIFCSPLOWO2_02_FULL_63_24]|nr:MAG: HAD family hydrolase [Rhodocyclales bacterium RIFCSPLOWO2_02_FULL_63_24]
MAKRFELIVFDWDGTLMDSTRAIVSSIQAAARDLDIEPPSDERASHIIGLGLIDALRHALPDLPSERYPAVAERYRHHYLLRDHELLLFDGAVELIDELTAAGHYLAVATGKTRKGLDRAFEVSGLGPRFHASRCADECHSKPHPQMLEELMNEFGVEPGETLMIGDTTHDLLMARNAGVAALGVAYGAHPRETLEMEVPLFCAANVSELAAWLRQQA